MSDSEQGRDRPRWQQERDLFRAALTEAKQALLLIARNLTARTSGKLASLPSLSKMSRTLASASPYDFLSTTDNNLLA